MRYLTYILIQLIVILALAPLVNGIIKKVKAFTQKRKGAPIFQLYYDLFKLLHKGVVISETASWIFKATPYVVFATALAAALFVPVSTMIAPGGFMGDFIMMVYIMALGRFFMTLAGLDTASTFGGMGSSRETMISSLIEPALLVSLFTVGIISKSTSIPAIMVGMKGTGLPLLNPVYIVIFIALITVIIAETSRIPVDDPATHLELTMVHEAMILEYSGKYLALMEYAAAVKQLVLITIVVNVFLPHDQLITISNIGAAVIISLAVYAIKVIITAVIIALVEVNTVKLRLFTVPNLAALAFILSFLGFLQSYVFRKV